MMMQEFPTNGAAQKQSSSGQDKKTHVPQVDSDDMLSQVRVLESKSSLKFHESIRIRYFVTSGPL